MLRFVACSMDTDTLIRGRSSSRRREEREVAFMAMLEDLVKLEGVLLKSLLPWMSMSVCQRPDFQSGLNHRICTEIATSNRLVHRFVAMKLSVQMILVLVII